MRSIRLPLVAVAVGSSVAAAQVKLEITPFFTSYFATAYTSQHGDSTERQEAGPGLGTTVTYRFNNIVGVQGTFAYAWSGTIPRYPPPPPGVINTNLPLPGEIMFAAARGTFQPRRSNYFLAAGAGLVKRSGTAWKTPGMTQLTNVMTSLGYGIRARVTPEFAFNIGVDLNLYFSNPDEALTYYQRRLQRDVLVSIGVPYALIER
ncbi:MAG TPA: hypothetical protein VJ867_06230 [Gemmatimonadaceae bacterium]|nr:hypothetical protein [Gemmatimonadaceae bacterium]